LRSYFEQVFSFECNVNSKLKLGVFLVSQIIHYPWRQLHNRSIKFCYDFFRDIFVSFFLLFLNFFIFVCKYTVWEMLKIPPTMVIHIMRCHLRRRKKTTRLSNEEPKSCWYNEKKTLKFGAAVDMPFWKKCKSKHVLS
jgi:hypothetical protein